MPDQGTSSGHVARLAILLACLGLATSRIGLIAHELVGHGGAAVLAGGDVEEVHLFWFAGGWIRYQLRASTSGFLFVAMGGIAIEIVIGTVAWLVARGSSRGARIVRGTCPDDGTPVGNRLLGRVAAVMAVAIVTVMAIDRVLN